MSRTRSLFAGIALAALTAGPALAADSIRVGVSAGPATRARVKPATMALRRLMKVVMMVGPWFERQV